MTAMKEQPSARQIYGTIGPACADVETLEAMFRAGMTGIRLNLSHVTLAQAADQVDALHKAAQRCGKQAELLIDMHRHISLLYVDNPCSHVQRVCIKERATVSSPVIT